VLTGYSSSTPFPVPVLTSLATPAVQARLPEGFRVRALAWDARQAAAWRVVLSDAERDRLDGFGPLKRRREFLLGRAALRGLLAEVLQTPPEAVPLRTAADGAVELAPEATPRVLHVSLTHRNGQAVAVAAPRPVGVDLEAVRPLPARVERYVLSDADRAALERLPTSHPSAVILAWALKEAVLKGLRVGLDRAPNKMPLRLDPEACAAYVRPAEGLWHARYARHACDGGAAWLAVTWPADASRGA
jgi:4'-phosphopantetheinyl transferase